MTIKLPRIINDYVDASNAHDVKSVVACFADNAFVHDEGKDFRSKKMIEDWITRQSRDTNSSSSLSASKTTMQKSSLQ